MPERSTLVCRRLDEGCAPIQRSNRRSQNRTGEPSWKTTATAITGLNRTRRTGARGRGSLYAVFSDDLGHARIPIMHWMRQQAAESLLHATEAGEEMPAMGGRVSLDIGELAGTQR